MECPINLECVQEECPNLRACKQWAYPWPLIYEIWEIDYWYPKGALVVRVPRPEEYEDGKYYADHECAEIDAHNEWINRIRAEARAEKWANAKDLPYSWDEQNQCLRVDQVLILNRSDPEEGFAPPVSLDNWRANWKSVRSQIRRALAARAG